MIQESKECCNHIYESACACCINECDNCSDAGLVDSSVKEESSVALIFDVCEKCDKEGFYEAGVGIYCEDHFPSSY